MLPNVLRTREIRRMVLLDHQQRWGAGSRPVVRRHRREIAAEVDGQVGPWLLPVETTI